MLVVWVSTRFSSAKTQCPATASKDTGALGSHMASSPASLRWLYPQDFETQRGGSKTNTIKEAVPSRKETPGLEASATQLGERGPSDETTCAWVVTTCTRRADQEDAAAEDLG